MKVVTVVAAAIIDAEDQILVTQRAPGAALAGLWEFPGGKIEPGETPEAALVRELREELDIAVTPEALAPLGFVSHAYSGFHLVLLLYLCRDWAGTPRGMEGQPLRRVTIDTLAGLPMPPADLPLVGTLRARLKTSA
ncbi:8-oxo-dGTP diphosphatase MutT [Polymorphobacter fuscus]|uniref:8-oxo-dGTP diphosphatase n=1 Tax=Sandarakinorhabdus fusca TaxID=1439888 RepID=A0A7C9KLG2_9SPHN|nr:8-oxo-dGTP diphosphatase MutT [Polymorphobacter fuscus]KAB7647821.1 8-oxo-dGTP diphosphatase MutT [Polymorphobacter fuscus]MQT17123.1 8-oxo-dGTP diphosphatase MutT [Polymorphobacter fuscus]NJC08885.1 8-oxo-dGTP diphosphatase [Polymorphobacter fuscus]